MGWIKDIVNPKMRSWEEFYRNRWQYDKKVRSTHGVNCTGGCSWEIFVKDGIVTWEMQALDYPLLEDSLPPYEPRGCQRGISYSWYLYSPIRVKYPYVRGALLDLWRAARQEHQDPVAAWTSLVSDDAKRKRYQRARGKGGFRRVDWAEVVEIISASLIHTIKKYGADRIVGFSPIPAMSFLSFAAGSRFLQLLGGVHLSFYDWYCDLPPAFPQVWGEQTDVCESADWYNAKFIHVMGANLNMTRTPDTHFVAEARHNGTKLVVASPDFSQVAKYADQWIPLNAGQDGAFWMAVNHVILKEYYVDQTVPYFTGYLKQYTDSPFLVELEPRDAHHVAGRAVRAGRLAKYRNEEKGDWKTLLWDSLTNSPKMPGGTIGHRWQTQKGQWNLELKDPTDGSPIDPQLSFFGTTGETLPVEFHDFGGDRTICRNVPVKFVETAEGSIPVATIFDLMMAQFGVGRGLDGEYPVDYDDSEAPFTPAWQQQWTGISKDTVIKFAREWTSTAIRTEGKCMVIVGAGINHWYHNDLIYRSAMTALMLCGCIGKNGGGMNHYVGQEKLAPIDSWGRIAMAKDWQKSSREQNAPSWHYVHSDQWRYEGLFNRYNPVPDNPLTSGHTVDMVAKSVRCGWLPFYPQFHDSNQDIVQKARAAGAQSDEDVSRWIAEKLKSRELTLAVEDPDAEENWPRVWFIWRGNALMSSAKGHEYFLKHYLGTHHNSIAKDEAAREFVQDVTWREKAPEGKMDLVIDLNFRMDTSALYSDIVLPAATWYEKADLNSTDMHSFIHPLSEAVPPSWESKSDWNIFKKIAASFSALAKIHLPDPVTDVVLEALSHDSPDECAQPEIKDWGKGECDPVPGKSMAHITLVERSYPDIYQKFISFGPIARQKGLGAHGVHYDIREEFDRFIASPSNAVEEWNGSRYPSLKEAEDAANVILHFSTLTNGALAHRAYKEMEEKVGLPLADLAENFRGVQYSYKDLQAQPRRLNNSPVWSGLVDNGRAYAGFTYNVERLVPWRTLTGRQHFYLDHEGFLAFGEHLPTFKPAPPPDTYGDLTFSTFDEKTMKMLNYLTPHGKWHIHSTYYDNHRMLTLSRGIEPFWMNDQDAADIGIADNDWVEAHNDNGVVVTRAVVSARIPRGVCIFYHSPERTISVPKSPLRNNRRAGGHNSLTRVRLKPSLMFGGYAQMTYHMNYWGPTGVNRDTRILVRKLEKNSLQW